jgi:hypothetical protein
MPPPPPKGLILTSPKAAAGWATVSKFAPSSNVTISKEFFIIVPHLRKVTRIDLAGYSFPHASEQNIQHSITTEHKRPATFLLLAREEGNNLHLAIAVVQEIAGWQDILRNHWAR